jgi:hypothetical protein
MEGDDLIPDYLAGCGPAASEVAHHLRVAVEVEQVIDVVLGELPQGKSLCSQDDTHVTIIRGQRARTSVRPAGPNDYRTIR